MLLDDMVLIPDVGALVTRLVRWTKCRWPSVNT